MSDIPPNWRENLTHMLGAGKHIHKSKHGYRNHFCASVLESDKDYQSMLEMEKAGLVKAGKLTNNKTCQFFHATIEGCKAIGLSEKAIERAMEGL